MKLFVALLPPSHREWGEALIAESSHTDKSVRWVLGGIHLMAWSWLDKVIGGNRMKTVVAILSTTNVAMGLFLMGLFLLTGNDAPVVLMLASGLVVQGGYTLWYVIDSQQRSWATHALLSGQAIALLIGTGGLAISALNNITPTSGDNEYGPIVVAAIIAAQAAATLYLYAVRRGTKVLTSR